MIVLNGLEVLETFTFDQKDDMVAFLENYFTDGMNLELTDVAFRVFDS